MYHQKNEERWWEMYLATLPLNEQSFDEWRKGSTKNISTQPKDITKEYIETAKNKAQNILSNFNPLK